MANAPCSACGSTQGPDHLCPGLSAQLVGKVLDGRYEIQAVLGQGGMGMVFQALQTSMRRPVAVKTLHASLAAAPAFFERFRREAETASRLHHPNVITIFDFGRTEDGTCYYVMELLQGESLKQIVKRDGPMSLRRAVRVVSQASLGLAHAHNQGCVHRDLKPHNIMVQHIDGQEFVKVLDFGLVKALEQDDEEQLTSTGQVLGTPQYMPPEQAGGELVDRRSDLYSMTGVLYYCLTGTSPFGANTVRKALTAALKQTLAPVATRRSGAAVPRAIDELLRKGLAAEKADRYQSADELIEQMNAALAGLTDLELDARPNGRVDDGKEPGSGSQSGARDQGKGPGQRTPASGAGSRSGKSPSNVVVLSQAGRPAQATVSAARRATAPEIPSLKGSAATPAPRADPKVPGGAGKKLIIAGGSLALLAIGGAVLWKLSPPPGVSEAPQAAAIPTMAAVAPIAVRVAEPAGPQAQAVIEPAAFVTVTLLSVPPGAAVLEEGVQIGSTPLEYEAPRGELRTVSFLLANYLEAKRSFRVSAADKIEVTLEPVPKSTPARPVPRKKGSDIPTFD